MKKIIFLLLLCSSLYAQEWTTQRPAWYTDEVLDHCVDVAVHLHYKYCREQGLNPNTANSIYDSTFDIEDVSKSIRDLLASAKDEIIYYVVDDKRMYTLTYDRSKKQYSRLLQSKEWLKYSLPY